MTVVEPSPKTLVGRLRPPHLAIAGLLAAAALLALGAALAPETFYDPIVWKSYDGPLHSMTRRA